MHTLSYYRNRGTLSAAAAPALATDINYFRRHTDKMQYAAYRAAGLPIGSGVTEAGGKELTKTRSCRSGMRWQRETAAPFSICARVDSPTSGSAAGRRSCVMLLKGTSQRNHTLLDTNLL